MVSPRQLLSADQCSTSWFYHLSVSLSRRHSRVLVALLPEFIFLQRACFWPIQSTFTNRLNFDCLLWLPFCWACCLSTLSAVLGLRKSSRVRIRLPNNSSQGVVPVVAWGVSLWVARVLLSLDQNVPSWFLFSSAFKICTARLASLLDAGWYGAHVTCCMLFTLRNASNSELTKQLPLSKSVRELLVVLVYSSGR